MNTLTRSYIHPFAAAALVAVGLLAARDPSIAQEPATAQPDAGANLVDLAGIDPSSVKARFASVERGTQPGTLILNFEESTKWPSVDFKSAAGIWNLSASRGVEATLINQGDTPITTFVEVRNPGHTQESPKSNSGKGVIQPGDTQTIRVLFGEAANPKRTAYNLDRVRSTTYEYSSEK
jgi:hypothetical protein